MISEARVAGHFGEWLQGTLGPDGPVVLVTLPCPALGVTATWAPDVELRIGGPDADILPRDRALRLLRRLGLPTRGAIAVSADMPAGGGAGASTAALVALARAAGFDASPDRLAAACLAAEGATDPLMLDEPDGHLWASREGRSLAALLPPPEFEIVGGFLGPPIRTNPTDRHLPDVSDLMEAWRAAVRCGDRAGLARTASRSAERTTALRGPAGDPTAGLASACGALGHVRGHTGSSRGLVYPPGGAPAEIEDRLRQAGYDRILRFRTGRPA